MTSQLSINGGNFASSGEQFKKEVTALPVILQPNAMKNSNSIGEPYKQSSRKGGSNTFGGTSRSMSVVHPEGQGRKAIREGLDMLEAKFIQKDSL